MSFSTSWAEGDTILYGVNVNKRHRRRVASAPKTRWHRNKNPFRSFILSFRPEAGNPFWGHTIIYHSPLMRLTVFIPVNPHFPNFSFVNYLFFPYKSNRPLIFFFNPHLVTLMSPRHVSIFFPSPSSTLPFSSPVFVHTQSAIIPPCRRDSGQ